MINCKLSVSCLSLVGVILGGCSIFGRNQPPTIPAPPSHLNSSAPLTLPPMGHATKAGASSTQVESSPTRFKQITEERGPGGVVNKIKVDNPTGGMPDYYIYPTPSAVAPTNNNPDKISPPNWQWNW